ncbi:hypothetical protein FPV67DRAFT_1669934 [Lyophyllum atratum]|nr:hypothetical protein FPV67DRAFT_1669934 [Lyophyllum atratum]
MSTLNARSAWGSLANATGPNVLFGDHSPPLQFRYSTANFRTPVMTTGGYELETGTSPDTYMKESRSDPEFGIHVSKVTNTVLDPPAKTYHSTQ